jgi:hypothetical protein
MTLTPNNSHHTERVLLCFAPRKQDSRTRQWKQCCLFFIIIKTLCIMISLLKVRQLDFYVVVQRHLQHVIRRKRPEMWIVGSWLLRNDNVPAHTALLIRQF